MKKLLHWLAVRYGPCYIWVSKDAGNNYYLFAVAETLEAARKELRHFEEHAQANWSVRAYIQYADGTFAKRR